MQHETIGEFFATLLFFGIQFAMVIGGAFYAIG